MAKKNRNNAYWEQRAEKEREWQLRQLKNDETFNQLIQKHYNQALVDIDRDIDAQFNRLAKANRSTVEEARKAVSQADIKAYQAEAKKVVEEANQMRAAKKRPTYNDWSDEVNERMRIYNATMRINRLEYLKSQIGLEMVQAGYKIDDDLQAKIANDYTDELKRQASILATSAKGTLWTSKEVQAQIMAQTNGATFSQRLWANQDALKARLDAVLNLGIVEGSGPAEMARQVKDLIKDTVKNYTYVAERIARTESARVQHAAQIKSIRDSDYRYVKWYAEPSACKYCREIADNDEEDLGIGVFNVDDCPDIPVHPNCRCSVSAYWVDGKNNLNRSHPNLTDDEEGAIRRYISSDAYKINDGLRNGGLTTVQLNTVNQLDRALEKMPRYRSKKPLYRDYFFNSRKDFFDFASPLSPGSTFIDPAFLSTSKLHYGEGQEQLHVIIKDSKSGRDITEFNQAEQEVLFPRNTKLKVVDAYINDEDIPTLEMKEI